MGREGMRVGTAAGFAGVAGPASAWSTMRGATEASRSTMKRAPSGPKPWRRSETIHGAQRSRQRQHSRASSVAPTEAPSLRASSSEMAPTITARSSSLIDAVKRCARDST